jgi:hypothetical protein
VDRWIAVGQRTIESNSSSIIKTVNANTCEVFEQILEHLRQKPLPVSSLPGWSSLKDEFSVIWIADGSTLEELKKRLKIQAGKGTVLAEKMMVIVDLFTHRPVFSWYTTRFTANEFQK